MQEVRGSNLRLDGLRVRQYQASGGISTLQSRASGLQSTTQSNYIGTIKDSSELNNKHEQNEAKCPTPPISMLKINSARMCFGLMLFYCTGTIWPFYELAAQELTSIGSNFPVGCLCVLGISPLSNERDPDRVEPVNVQDLSTNNGRMVNPC